MELKILESEEFVKNNYKWLIKKCELVEENEKMFIRYSLDKVKEMRIFFKNVLLNPEKREHIKHVWSTGEGIEELIDSLWIVKSNSSGVLLFVPKETEKTDKSGIYILTISKSFFYPNPLYFKRSYITGEAISLFYLMPKNLIFLLGGNNINLIYNNNGNVTLQKYYKFNSNS